MFAEKHNSSNLLFHLLGEAYLFWQRYFRADPRANVSVKTPIQLLYLDKLLDIEVFKYDLDCRTPFEVSLVCVIVGWQFDCLSHVFLFHNALGLIDLRLLASENYVHCRC